MKIIVTSLLIVLTSIVYAEDSKIDIWEKIQKNLPKGWSAEINKSERPCTIIIKTNKIETKASMYLQGHGRKKSQLNLKIVLLPRYSQNILKNIDEYNTPIKKKLKNMDYYSQEYQNLSQKLIKTPLFYDGRYGYEIGYIAYVPQKKEDQIILINFLEKISEGWKAYKKDMIVIDELKRILTN